MIFIDNTTDKKLKYIQTYETKNKKGYKKSR